MILKDKYILKDGSIYWHRLYYDLMPKFMTAHSLPGIGGYNLAHYLSHPWEIVEDYYREAKWFIQRGSRGYADRDVWSVDYYLTSFMGKALRQLADQVHGTPIIDTGRPFTDLNDCDSLTMEEWKATILYIAESFDEARKIEDYDYMTTEDVQRAVKRFNHGMGMFTEYFINLWD